MHDWVGRYDCLVSVLQQDAQTSERKLESVFSLRIRPSQNGSRILIWLQNNELTRVAGRWRYVRTVEANRLQVFQYLIEMATRSPG